MDAATFTRLLDEATEAVERDARLLDLMAKLADWNDLLSQRLDQQADDLRALSNRIEAVTQQRGGLHSVKT